MDLVKVDAIDPEPSQAVVDLRHDGDARHALSVGTRTHPRPDLRGDHHLFAPREVLQRPANDLLAGAVGIDVGGVKEVYANFERAPDDRPALLVVQSPRMRVPVRKAEMSCTRDRCAKLQVR